MLKRKIDFMKHTEESKRIIGKKSKQMWANPKIREKIQRSRKQYYDFMKTPAGKKWKKEIHKDYRCSEETKEKINNFIGGV